MTIKLLSLINFKKESSERIIENPGCHATLIFLSAELNRSENKMEKYDSTIGSQNLDGFCFLKTQLYILPLLFHRF